MAQHAHAPTRVNPIVVAYRAETRHDAQAALAAVVEGAGFEAKPVSRGAVADCDSALLRVSGMTCSSCSSAVEHALQAHKGVQVKAVTD